MKPGEREHLEAVAERDRVEADAARGRREAEAARQLRRELRGRLAGKLAALRSAIATFDEKLDAVRAGDDAVRAAADELQAALDPVARVYGLEPHEAGPQVSGSIHRWLPSSPLPFSRGCQDALGRVDQVLAQAAQLDGEAAS